jgi:hypothetical protein
MPEDYGMSPEEMGEIIHEQMIRTACGQGVVLLTPRPGFENDFESWAPYDPAGDAGAQHREIEARLRRYFKTFVRRALNAFVKLRQNGFWIRQKRDAIARSGYTLSSLSYHHLLLDCEALVARVTYTDFTELVDHARTAGFLTTEEAADLLTNKNPIPLDESLDPRPTEYVPRPIFVGRITEFGQPIDEEGNPVDRPRHE